MPLNATVSDGTSIQKPLIVGETVKPLNSPDSLELKEKEDKKWLIIIHKFKWIIKVYYFNNDH